MSATMHHRGICPGKLPALLKLGCQAIVVALARSIFPRKMPSRRPGSSTHCPPRARAPQRRQGGSAQAGGTRGTQLLGSFMQLPSSFLQGRRPAATRACRCSSPPTQRSPTPAPRAASKHPGPGECARHQSGAESLMCPAPCPIPLLVTVLLRRLDSGLPLEPRLLQRCKLYGRWQHLANEISPACHLAPVPCSQATCSCPLAMNVSPLQLCLPPTLPPCSTVTSGCWRRGWVINEELMAWANLCNR